MQIPGADQMSTCTIPADPVSVEYQCVSVRPLCLPSAVLWGLSLCVSSKVAL